VVRQNDSGLVGNIGGFRLRFDEVTYTDV